MDGGRLADGYGGMAGDLSEGESAGLVWCECDWELPLQMNELYSAGGRDASILQRSL